jgi:hypothetical protein
MTVLHGCQSGSTDEKQPFERRLPPGFVAGPLLMHRERDGAFRVNVGEDGKRKGLASAFLGVTDGEGSRGGDHNHLDAVVRQCGSLIGDERKKPALVQFRLLTGEEDQETCPTDVAFKLDDRPGLVVKHERWSGAGFARCGNRSLLTMRGLPVGPPSHEAGDDGRGHRQDEDASSHGLEKTSPGLCKAGTLFAVEFPASQTPGFGRISVGISRRC